MSEPAKQRSSSNALLAVPSRQGSAGSMLMPQAYNSLILEQRLGRSIAIINFQDKSHFQKNRTPESHT